MKRFLISFLSLIIMLTIFAPTAVFAGGATTVGDGASLISAINGGYTDITVSGGATINPSSKVSIPSGTTVTLESGGYFLTLSCTIENNGTIINNNNNLGNNSTIDNYGSIVNNGKFYNNSSATITNANTGTISNIGTFSNQGSISNNGTIISTGTWTNTGTYTGAAVGVDSPVELINGSNITYYTTLESALAVINNTGYELRLLKDLTVEGNVTMPIVGFTLSGTKTGGGVSTLTVNNGDFNTTAAVVLKDIKLVHTGTSGGNFNTYYQYTAGGVTKYYKTDLTVQTGVTFTDIDIKGRSDTLDPLTNTAKGSALNIQGNVDLGSNSILDIRNINISNGGTLKIRSLQTDSLSFNNGGTLDITGAGGLTVTGTLSSDGSGDNILSLPAPSDHSGTVYGAILTNTSIGGTSPIKIYPTSGVSFSNKSKLIYLNNTTVADNKFVSGVAVFSAARRTLDDKQYITFLNSTNTTLSCAEAPITYGVENFTLKAAVKDGNNAAVTSGTVKFYKGTSSSGSLLATVGLDSSGNAQCSVNAKDYAAIGDNGFYALYEDASDYYSQSSGTVTVHMNGISLGISGVNISSKAFDGTTAATISGITLSGIVGTDNVTASAIAVFADPGAGKNKAVNLSDIKLGGEDAGYYTIASTITNISTTAEITKATPVVQLAVSPVAGAVNGDTVNLTANVTSAAVGTVPSGTVKFYNGSTLLGTVACTAEGKAVYTLNNAPVGSYNFSAEYSGDANYNAATGSINSYIVGKKVQANLTVSGVPAKIYYGDPSFPLSTAGGSGEGAVSYAVATGTSISVGAATGTVTIVGVGKSVVMVSKAGTGIYEPISAEVTVDVMAKSLTISGISITDKAYDGTTAATITGITLSGIVGTDNVTASAVAVFVDSGAGKNKGVDLSDIKLGGGNAGNYTIESTSANISTTAEITKATPVVQLAVSPVAGAVNGDTVNLTANVTSAAVGTVPSGTVKFYNGSTLLGTVACTAEGKAVYTLNNAPVGSYNFSAEYSGDANYNTGSATIDNYIVSKKNQSELTVSGVPAKMYYGGSSFTLSTAGGSGEGAVSYAVATGTSISVGAATGTVTIVGVGKSVVMVSKAGTGIYEPISAEVTVDVAAKSLTISGVSVKDKAYDGTTAATVTGINLSGIVGTDNVTAGAVAVFRDADIGENKAVDLSGIHLAGNDAGKYTIASTAAAITTTAIVSKAAPTVQLIAPNATSLVPGGTVNLTATVTGAVNGAAPSGSIAFFKEGVELGTVPCTSGQAIYIWNNIPAGTYSLEAHYSGDGKYTSATDTITGLTVSKLNQAALTVSGVPASVHYGDASFTLSASGGSGNGTVSFAVKSGKSLNVAANTGKVTIVGAGESIITVTRAGTSIYQPVSTEVKVNVDAKSLSVSGASVEDKEYDGTTVAKVTGGAIEGGLVAGDDVTLVTSAAVGLFSDKNIGKDKSVTISGYVLGGADAVNYVLKQPLPLTADIQKRNITVKAVEIETKTFDGTTAAAVAYVALNGKVDGEEVYVPTPTAIAAFSDASVGTGKPVSVTGLVLAGVDAANYALASSTASAIGSILTDGDVFPPKFSPVEDIIYSGTKITFITETTGASLYYTLDGSEPTIGSNTYNDPISITGNPGDKVTIKALAVKTGKANSVTTKEYTIAKPGTFSILCEPGNQMVMISWDAIPQATYKVYNGSQYLGLGTARSNGKFGYEAIRLTNGTQYTFTVQELNSGGCITKIAQGSAIPKTVPGAPNGITATAGDGKATVSFQVPVDNGGSAITEYIVTSSPGGITVKGTGSPITISGLTNGITYVFIVKAVNAAGNGESSSVSNAVTPSLPPSSDPDDTSSDNTTPTPASTTSQAAVTVPAITETPGTGNGAPVITGTVNAVGKDDGKGNATVTLTDGQVTDALNKTLEEAAKKGGDTEAKVEIKVTAPVGAKSVDTGIPKSAVDAVAGSKAVAMSVSTPLAALSFDGNSLDTISRASGDVKISVSKVDSATLSTEVKSTVGDRPVFNFNVTSGNQVISQFGGNVTVSIPYTPKAGEDLNAIVVYYINSEGKPEAVGNCAYDPATGTIRFITSHFSTYAVGYNKVSFKDVAANAWYAKAVGFVAARGITEGTGNGNFSPEAILTRGQLLVMLMKAYGISPDKAPKDNFADAGNTWYTGYLAAAKRLGITNGVGNNKFAPEMEITQQEMYTLSYNALKSTGQLQDNPSGKTLRGFTDADKVAIWAKEAMAFMVNNGIAVNSGSKLYPEGKANRAHMAQALYNLLSK